MWVLNHMLKNIIYKSAGKNACGLEWLWHFSKQPLAGIIHADQTACAAIVRPTNLFTRALSSNFFTRVLI